jgi:hypothetical protein
MRSDRKSVARTRRALAAAFVALISVGVVSPALASSGSLSVRPNDVRLAAATWTGSTAKPVKKGSTRDQRQLNIFASDERSDGRVVCVRVEMRQGSEPFRLVADQCAKREPRGVKVNARLRYDRRLSCEARVQVRVVGSGRSTERASVTRACDRI